MRLPCHPWGRAGVGVLLLLLRRSHAVPNQQNNPRPLSSMGAGRGGGPFLNSTAAARHSPPDTCIAPTAMLFGGRPTEHRALSSAVEHYLDTVGVASSILAAPTIRSADGNRNRKRPRCGPRSTATVAHAAAAAAPRKRFPANAVAAAGRSGRWLLTMDRTDWLPVPRR